MKLFVSTLVMYTKKLLNAHLFKKVQVQFSCNTRAICNTSADYKWFLIGPKTKETNKRGVIRLELLIQQHINISLYS